MTDKFNNRQDIRKRDRIIFVMPFIYQMIVIAQRNINDDIWFVLNHGRYVLEKGIPHIEPFTIHQGFQFVMQQWLSALIFWVAYFNMGTIGLKILVLLCDVLTVFFLYKLSMKISKNYFFISFCITLLSTSMMTSYMTERPYVFTSLILVIELYLLESYLSSKKNKYLFFMPVLSLLLINLEAAMWPILFVILLPYIVDSFHFKIGPLTNSGYKKRPLFLSIGFMIAAGFLNPYGADGMTYLFRSYGYVEISNFITEMLPPNINTIEGFVIYVCIFIVILIYLTYRKGTTKLRYILLTVGTCYMTLSSYRSFSLFSICGVFPLAYYLRNFEFPAVKQNEITKSPYLLRITLIVLILAIGGIGLHNAEIDNKEAKSKFSLIEDAINYIQSEKQTNKVQLYTYFGYGGMVEFLGMKTYIDPRAEVFVKRNNNKADVMKEYYELQTGTLYYKEFIDKYQFTHLIVSKNDILYYFLQNDDEYQIFFSNEEFTLFKKNPMKIITKLR